MSARAEAVRAAHAMGYRVTEDGGAISPSGRRRKLFGDSKRPNTAPYLRFNIRVSGVPVGVYVHKLAAYQLFGEDSLRPGTHVRHLDGDSTNNQHSNLALGSQSENMMDRAPEVRRRHALKAAAAKRKLTREQVLEIVSRVRDRRERQKDLAEEFGVKRSTVCELLQGKIYSELSGIPQAARSANPEGAQ